MLLATVTHRRYKLDLGVFRLFSLAGLLLVTASAQAGAGTHIFACVYMPPGTVDPSVTFDFTVGGPGDQCMNEIGDGALLQVREDGLSCVSIGYVEGKSSSSGGDFCATASHRILGEGQAESMAHLVPTAGAGTVERPEGGRAYDLSLGKYDVTISTGPSFATQREAARETLLELMRHVPDAAPIIGDLFLEHMDFVGADRVAKRLRALLPPAIQQLEKAGDEGKEDATVQLAQLADQFQRAQATIKEGQAALAALQDENKQLKTVRDLEQTRLQQDFQLRTQALELQRQELALKTVQAETQQAAQQAFQAEQNELDRQAELAETAIREAPKEKAVAVTVCEDAEGGKVIDLSRSMG